MATTAGAFVPGCSIALLGIDGVGKTTLTAELHRRLADSGVDAVRLSRREYLKRRTPGFVGETTRTLYEASLRTLYGLARLPEGRILGDSFPAPPGDVMAPDFEALLDSAPIQGNDPRALTASMLCEIAGHTVFRATVVLPAVAQGKVVIEDTYGIKSVVKLYLLTQALLTSGDPLLAQARSILDMAVDLLRPGGAPSLPVLVHAKPEIAYERRVRQKGRVGGMEHYGPAGRTASRASYLELQERSQHLFDEIGDRWDCMRVDLTDTGPGGEPVSVRTAADEIVAAVGRLRQDQADSDRSDDGK